MAADYTEGDLFSDLALRVRGHCRLIFPMVARLRSSEAHGKIIPDMRKKAGDVS